MSRVIVITGGSGYIGSIIAYHLASLGHTILIIDKKEPSSALRPYGNIFFFQGDYADAMIWRKITTQFSCDVLIHCAACIEVGESIIRPLEYYDNNVAKLIGMLRLVRESGISCIIAASSSAVYGNPVTLPMPEHHQRAPLSPYGRTKVMLEDILTDYHHTYGGNLALLRFANVSGAMPEYGLGECHEPETHLIPRLIRATQQSQAFLLYGADHDTPDGTCVRDFIHVYDVARLHALLINTFSQQQVVEPMVLNVGSGIGISVKQIIACVSATTGTAIIAKEMPRRMGDAPSIVLDTQTAYCTVGWKPIMSDISTIVTSACTFHRAYTPHPLDTFLAQ